MGNLSEKTKPQPDYSGRGCIKRLFLLYKRITLKFVYLFYNKKIPDTLAGDAAFRFKREINLTS